MRTDTGTASTLRLRQGRLEPSCSNLSDIVALLLTRTAMEEPGPQEDTRLENPALVLVLLCRTHAGSLQGWAGPAQSPSHRGRAGWGPEGLQQPPAVTAAPGSTS